MPLDKKIENKVLTRLHKASLHLIEAAHLCWNNDERELSNRIRDTNREIETIAGAQGGSRSTKIRTELTTPKKRK